jgi:hypothetical protein
MKSDTDTVREIEGIIRDHLAAIKSEAHKRILELGTVDRDKAWEEVSSAVDAYGSDMLSDATHWLRGEVTNYVSHRWAAAVARHKKG